MEHQQKPDRRPCLVLFSVVLLHWLVNLYWLHADTRPWIWDMAFHARLGLDYLDWLQEPSLERLHFAYRESLQYPPLYHYAEAVSYALFGRSEDAAAFPNLFFFGLMLWAIFRIGVQIGGAELGLWAALLASLCPMLVWLSRSPLLDLPLTAFVCVGIHLLLETDQFCRRKYSVLFGLVCGLGMLVKWSFLFFVAGPALLVYFQRPTWKQRICVANALLALTVAVFVASAWYLPKAHFLLIDYLPQHASEGAAEGDPSLFSALSWISYFQFLLGYQLFVPLAAMLGVGVYWGLRLKQPVGSVAILWVWVGSSWLLLTLLRNKDPRYSAPLLPALALLAAAGLVRNHVRKGFKWLALGVALLQFLAISFPLSFLPEKVSLGALRGSNYPWQVFSTTYEGFLGPPRGQHWPIADLLSEVAKRKGDSLYVVPDHPYFSPEVFLYSARLHRTAVEVHPLWAGDFPRGGSRDYFVVKTGDQGDPRTTGNALRLTAAVRKEPGLRPLGSYGLPDGTFGVLYGPAETK